MLLAVAHLRGPLRVAMVVLIGSGLTLTLSRASIATVVVAAGLLALRSRGRRRVAVVGLSGVAGVGALLIPVVRHRIFDSFGPNDGGSLARNLALREFPRAMEGHWIWGLGWVREEFRDAAVNFHVNFAANAPLVTVYRGGIVVGVVAVLVLVVLVVRSWHAAARSFETAVVCCGVIGFVLVAMQLDYPVVLQAPATALFSFLVGLTLAPDRSRDHEMTGKSGWLSTYASRSPTTT